MRQKMWSHTSGDPTSPLMRPRQMAQVSAPGGPLLLSESPVSHPSSPAEKKNKKILIDMKQIGYYSSTFSISFNFPARYKFKCKLYISVDILLQMTYT